MNKATLRSTYLEKRLLLTDEEMKRRNAEMMETFLSEVDLQNVQRLHVYLTIAQKKEPDTFSLIRKIKSKFPKVEIVISRSLAKGVLEHFVWDTKEDLQVNKWGIPEPKGGISIKEEEVDMVLVPALAFDREGNRIGYGKGYYDRFLSRCRPDVRKVGYSFAMPLDHIPYAEETDVKMDCCVFPGGYLDFS